MLTKILAAAAVLALSLTVTILSLMLGWGLEPKNWAAIVFIGFFGQLIVQAVGQQTLKEK